MGKKRITQKHPFVNLTVDNYLFYDKKSTKVGLVSSRKRVQNQNLVYNFSQKEQLEKL